MITVLVACSASAAVAVPAPQGPVRVRQPDGEELLVRMTGDEFGGTVETLDGYTLAPSADGTWHYAVRGADGRLAPSGVRVGRGGAPAAGLPRHLRHDEVHERRAEEARRRFNQDPPARRRQGGRGAAAAPSSSLAGAGAEILWAAGSGFGNGSTVTSDLTMPPVERLAVLLVDFSDVPGTYAPAQFEQLFFSQGTYRTTPAGQAATGSVREYLAEVSYGKLALTGAVFGWVHTGLPRSTYLNDYGRLVADAVALSGVDLAQFDDYVIVWAGNATYGTSLWPSSFKGGPQLRVAESFLAGDITDVGVIIHELAHVFGEYDHYYLPNNYGYLDPMAYGNYACGGRTPPHYSFDTKARFGWVVPTKHGEGTYAARTLAPYASAPAVDLYVSELSHFYVENRQRVGFDACIPAAGLHVYHDETPWEMGMDLEFASGVSGDFAGVAFPGTSGNTRFGCRSTPSSVEPDSGACALTLAHIVAPDVPATDVTTDRTATFDATVAWSHRGVAVDGAGSYPTLFAALEFAAAGQTVTLPAGEHAGHAILREGVAVRGAGPGATVLRQPRVTGAILLGAPNASVSSLTLQGEGPNATFAYYAGLTAWRGPVTVSNVVARDFSYGLYLGPGVAATVTSSVLDGNGVGLYGAGATSAIVARNDAFVGNGTGIQLGAGSAGAGLDYNAFDANGTNVVGPPSWGPHDVVAAPLFEQPVVGRYALQAGSPLRDAGDPALLDPDGTRADIGAFGGPGARPPVADAPPIASASPAATTVVRGSPATLDGSLSVDDGGIAAFAWDLDGDGVADETLPRATVAWPATGTYLAWLSVRDAAGQLSRDVVQVSVVDPPIAFLLPAAGDALASGQNAQAQWRFTGRPASFVGAFSLDGGVTWTDVGTTGSSYSPTSIYWTVPAVAAATPALFRARALDAAGAVLAEAISSPFTIRPLSPRTLTVYAYPTPFRPQRVHTSAAQSLYLSNPGTEPLTVSAVSVEGAGASQFAAGSCSGPIRPGMGCSLAVTFAPTVVGAHQATLTIVSDDPWAPVRALPLAGTGTAPAGPHVEVAPAAVSLGTVDVGARAAATLWVSNQGQEALVVSSVALAPGTTAELAVARNDCAVVAPGGSCTVEITLAPSSSGPKRGTLLLVTDDAETPSVAVALSGEAAGGTPRIAVSPAALAFGGVGAGTSSPAQVVLVSNPGSAPLAVRAAAPSGADAGQFVVTSNGCASVAPGSTCTVAVAFAPTSAGAKQAGLDITSDDPVTPTATVALSGTGVAAAPAISVAPSSLAFGTVRRGSVSSTKRVTVTNSGTGSLTVSPPTLGGAGASQFRVTSNGCASPLVPGGTCTVGVAFAPTSTGSKTATLTLGSNAAVSPTQAVSLGGTGR